MEEHRQTSNRVDIYSYRQPYLHSFCVGLYIKAGVLYENADETGITHFLEHIYFRNLDSIPQRKLYEELESIGAEFNGCTYKEFVYFYIKASPEHFNRCARIIAALLAPITASKADVSAERKRIQSEIRECDDRSTLAYYADREIWKGTPLTRLTTGTVTQAGKISLDMLRKYQKRIICEGNLFFYVTGNFTPENLDTLCEQIEKYAVQRPSETQLLLPERPLDFQKRDGVVLVKNYDYMPVIRLSFDVDYPKYSLTEMDLLYDILFSAQTSRYHMLLSEEKGFLYDFDATLERYRGIGTVSLEYSIIYSQLYESLRLTAQVFHSVKNRVEQKDLQSVTPRYVYNNLFYLDDPKELNWEMAYTSHIVGNGHKSIEELNMGYQAVSPQRIREIASDIFKTGNLVVAVKGERRKINSEKIREILALLDSK